MKLNTLLTSALMISPLIANDFFFEAEAIAYDGTADSFEGDTSDATREVGEPDHGALNTQFAAAVASRWYSVTVTEPHRIEVSIDFQGVASGLDSVVAVYTGTDVQNLTMLSRYPDIDFPAFSRRLFEPFGSLSRFSFDAVPGETYYIAVDGEGNKGPYRLILQPSRDPHNPTAEMIAPNSNWRTLIARDGGTPVDPLTIDAEFFDKWHDSAELDALGFEAPAPTPMGYGIVDGLDIITGLWSAAVPSLQPPSGNSYTVYLRTSFTPGSQIDGLGFEGLFDDGAIFYVNGEEVARTNVDPLADALNWQTVALSTDLPDPPELPLPPSEGGRTFGTEHGVQYATAPDVILPAGVPVEIGVSLHNQSGTSSDMAFNMRVWALGGDGVVVPYIPPFLATITPTGAPSTYTISWPSKEGETYQIQSSTTLESDDWTDVFPSDIDPSGTGTTSRNVNSGATQRFYRVIIR